MKSDSSKYRYIVIRRAKRLQSVMTSLTRYCIFDHSPWQKHRNYFILRSEHLEQSNLMLQEYWISHSILRTRGMRKYIIFLVILAYSLSTIYTCYLYYFPAASCHPHVMPHVFDKAMRQQIASSWQGLGVSLDSGLVQVQSVRVPDQSEFLH